MAKGAKQGQDVKLVLESADASAGVAMQIIDANNAVVTLKSWDRLVIDAINVSQADGTGLVSVFDPSVGGKVIFSSEDTAGTSNWDVEGEGLNVAVGVTPSVSATTAGQVVVVAAARIVHAGTQPGRQNWRERLTPGGNF